MNPIEILIADKIKKIDSTLDLQGADRKMLQLACKDFTNYMKFSHRSAYNLGFEEKIERFSDKEHSELDAFLTVWTGMWIKKWQQRVKLFMGERNKNEQRLQAIPATAGSMWQTLDCRQELIDIVESTLINKGEICGTQNIAENITKEELTKSNNLNINDKAQAIAFLSKVMQKAHEIANTTGPLMFVEVNKAYYNSVTTQM